MAARQSRKNRNGQNDKTKEIKNKHTIKMKVPRHSAKNSLTSRRYLKTMAILDTCKYFNTVYIIQSKQDEFEIFLRGGLNG